VGPPGVAKTSLGKSIARALGRKFHARVAGWGRDEAEIRGHRRTYVGSLPGRIVQGMKKAGSNNPVFMLDEIDKLGTTSAGSRSGFAGGPRPGAEPPFSTITLRYRSICPRFMFIARPTSRPGAAGLRDRLEVLEIPGYTSEEKLNIAKQFLIKKQLDEHGLGGERVVFEDTAVVEVIDSYTREAGVRNLERELATSFGRWPCWWRKKRRRKRKPSPWPACRFLGPQKYLPRWPSGPLKRALPPAWLDAGGRRYLFIEATRMTARAIWC